MKRQKDNISIIKYIKKNSEKKVVVNIIIKKKIKMKRVSRRMKGRGLVSFIRKAVGFLRKHHVISKVANFAGSVLPGKYGSIASSVGKTAGSVGFGRRRRRRGRGLRLAGGH